MVCIKSGCVKSFEISHQDICVDGRGGEKGKRTWMLSRSNRQSSTVWVSGRFGTRTVERDLPSNMREMGDFTELAYSCP